jgi:peptidoglycan/xylan/chitin deacetylase (PgdA/CDA1 family)
LFDLTLSFDNGPEPDVTPLVLDVLARRGIKTTFFVIGEKLADPRRRRLAERAHDEGHWLGNHTYTHSIPLGRLSGDDVSEREIGKTQQLLGGLSHPRRWFRPFGGGGNLDDGLLRPHVVNHLMAGRYSCVLWNAIPRDWEDPDGWVDRALAQCTSQARTLMVLHDLPTGAMFHLDRFLDRAGAAGVRFNQEFPPNCVPIRSGEIVLPIDSYVSNIEESNL